MERDWGRLGAAIRASRQGRGWTQEELAVAAGVSRASVQNLEQGRDFRRVPQSLNSVSRALEWPGGHAARILDGLPVDEAEQAPHPADNLPMRVAQELEEGELIDTQVIDLGEADGARMIVVVKGKPNATPDAMRQALLEWRRVQRDLEEITVRRVDKG